MSEIKLWLRCFLVALLATSVVASKADVCKDGQIVRCLIDPCSTPPPPDCRGIARCESDYCGGCNRHYYNADGVEVCQPRAAEASECDQSTCTPPECPQGSTVEQDADDCCPHCASSQAPCSNVRCNMHPECPQGWLIETAPGECCPTCKPRSDCSKLCKMRCPNGYVLDENGCPTCECLPFS